MSRASEALADIPPSTRCILALCLLTYAYQFLFDPPLHNFTMCPRNVLYMHEFYRVITSALFHGGLMHIGMNSMSTVAIGSMLEKKIGTLSMGITILWGIILTSVVYVLVAWLLHATFGYERMMLQHSLGFSGVIFQLSVLESNLAPDRTRSVFGLFQVSSRMYPWALLVVLQFIMPHISFLGHLSGILVGTMQYYGALDVLFPSETCLLECETWDRLGFLRIQPGYVNVPEAGWRREAPQNLQSAIFAAFGGIFVRIIFFCQTVKIIIFGRGAEANANIQLSELGAAWGSGDAGATEAGTGTIQGSVEDDEEWVGLPAAIQRSTEEM
eukprot:CAMPEP_0172532426 /NCGR_PEP_ID=MMETSP1067-20121228/5483_1 /TAXON_ID=265564 ORGANISM="Thalassiosira punctigera, Strain Tpunct2005C2" /NCGR_SAMPLE_ID=MMETSP1067 /ASSEMBLY_ACC=CAM_ASM_000444 /LENGTH=327 /DNA_ID=CAMNT_0013316939 /DNA_START=52 /DNA_END=1035 /DNA_ORIENTATION=+